MKPFSLSYDAEKQCITFLLHQDSSVDELLMYFHIGRKQRYFYYRHRKIYKNNDIITQNSHCHSGDQITIDCKAENSEKIAAYHQPLSICYEDDLCVIVNKPSGILVHSDGINQTHTLHNMVQAYYHSQGIDVPVRCVHRLDKDTSGLIFYCKLPFFQAYFDYLLETKQIARIYLAWAEGIVQKPMTIQKGIARDRHHANQMRVSKTGAFARTDIIPLINHKHNTLIECHLTTGRTHQIRVHMASIQHPLLADPLYGNAHKDAKRLALHAWKLRFYHPLKNSVICVQCPLPDDMPYPLISEKALQ